MSSQPALACCLTSPDRDQRLASLRTGLFARALYVRQDRPDGMEFVFANTAANVEDLLEFIRFERQCCPFLNFMLTAMVGQPDVTLEISGTDDASLTFITRTFFPLLPEGLLFS